MKIFCINSIKGGSGKTTVSLAILYNRARAYMTAKATDRLKDKTKEYRFAYVDLDLQGTGVSRLIFSDEDRENIEFYNNMDIDHKKYYECCNSIPAAEKDNLGIDVYLLNDSDDCKGIYRADNRELFETRHISRFKRRAQKLVKKILDSGIYDTVVLDNSPSYDYISADIYDFVCRNYNTEENQIVNAFVTTLEKSHVYTTISKVNNILRKNEYNIGIHVICNDMNGYIGSESGKNHVYYRKELFKNIENWNKNTRKSISPLDLPGALEKDANFTENRIVFMEQLQISKEFVFTERNVLNQIGILEKFSSELLYEGFCLGDFEEICNAET